MYLHSFISSVIDCEWLTWHLCRFGLVKGNLCPLCRRIGPETFWIYWRKETPISLPGSKHRTVRPVISSLCRLRCHDFWWLQRLFYSDSRIAPLNHSIMGRKATRVVCDQIDRKCYENCSTLFINRILLKCVHSKERNPRFHDDRHMRVGRLSTLRNGRLYSLENIPGTHFFRSLVDPRSIVRSECLCQWNIPMTPSGIEPALFRLVAQCLKQLRLPQARYSNLS